jgi:3-hydroxyisobutyrate dehydrogenase-like beta-hydroxyacid dehydrogenase
MSEIRCIGFVGVGVMGEPMCRHLAAKSGRRMLAHDLAPEPLARLAAFGVESASLARICEEAELVFLSLPSGEIVELVAQGAEGLLARAKAVRIVADLSTSRYDITVRLGKQFEQRGIAFVDAPVMRTRAAAEAGTLAVTVGATAAAFAVVEPFIRAFASDVLHVGECGAGQVVKILNNMVVYETVLALAEARAIGVRAGVGADQLFRAFAACSADSFALRNQGFKAIAPQNFPERAFPVTYARKDLGYAVALAEQVGIDATGAKNLIARFDEAIAAGYGEKYAPAISLVVERGMTRMGESDS